MIKKKGTLKIVEGNPFTEELDAAISSLKDGEYNFFLLDNAQNRVLPQLKYLNGVVLKTISDQLPTHPPIGALYRYFEKEYAPPHYCNINGERFVYRDLKSEPATEMIDVIEAIIHHAQENFAIHVPTIEEMRAAESKDLYMDAFAETWKDYLANKQSHQNS